MFVPITDDLLEEAQDQLFQVFTDEKGTRVWDIDTGVNQRWYDIPDTCDIDRIDGMYAQQSGDSWHPLTRGINYGHDSDYDDIEDYPYRYDIRYNSATSKTQIEIWPKPGEIYAMRIEGSMEVGDFVKDADRASFDSRLILLYAIAYGKAHLGRQDAKSAMDAWTLRLNKIKANQHGTREYVRRNPSRPETEIQSRPKVI